MVSSLKVQLKNWPILSFENWYIIPVSFWWQVDDDEEVPLQCVLHVSGDARHSGDTVFPLNRHRKLLVLVGQAFFT